MGTQSSGNNTLLRFIREGQPLSFRQQLSLTVQLSLPAVLANTSAMVMQFIDAAMVGSLGAAASASIGLVAPLLWFAYGICSAMVQGFSVQVAQFIGAKKILNSRDTFRH